jgi:hypothetical protein
MTGYEPREFRSRNVAPPISDGEHRKPTDPLPNARKAVSPELLALLRLLIRELPADHDFATCPTCKEYGITGI